MSKIVHTGQAIIQVYFAIIEFGIISKPHLEKTMNITPGQSARYLATLEIEGLIKNVTKDTDRELWYRSTDLMADKLNASAEQMKSKAKEMIEYANSIKVHQENDVESTSNEWNAESIKQLRESKGWSTNRLAEELECSRPYISLVETGKRTVPDDWHEKLNRIVTDVTIVTA